MKDIILEKLQQLEEYVTFIENHRVTVDELNDNDVIRSALERNLQLALETVLDICHTIIAEENLKRPETYRETMSILAQQGILDKTFAERFAPALGFRNILVHRYEQIDVEKLHAFLQQTADFTAFSQHIARYLTYQNNA